MGDAWTENCRLCAAPLPTLLDAGDQPRATDYAPMPQGRATTWPKRFGCCPRCGLAQLLCPPPAAWLAPCVDWLAFNEPESHLDALAAQLTRLTGRGCVMAGLSPKDAGLLERLSSLDGRESWRLTPDILGLERRPADAHRARSGKSECHLSQNLPPYDCLWQRHILEHVHDLLRFLYTARKLIREDGWLFVEVPACEAELQSRDYARLWEEHTQYFTAVSLSNTLMMGGFSPLWTQRTRTGQEELLLVLARKNRPCDRAPCLGGGYGARMLPRTFLCRPICRHCPADTQPRQCLQRQRFCGLAGGGTSGRHLYSSYGSCGAYRQALG